MGATLQHHTHRWAMALGTVLVLTVQAGCVTHGDANLGSTGQLLCPTWRDFPASYYDNEDWAYFGCTNALNLNNMLETGSDAIQGRRLGPSSGVRESMAVDRYDQGKIKSSASTGAAAPTIIMPAGGGSAQ